MWRNLAKQAASRKTKLLSQSLFSSPSSTPLKFSQEPSFLEKSRHFDARACINYGSSLMGLRQVGVTSSQKDELGRPSLLHPTYPSGFSGFCKGYASSAEAIASTDEDSGSEEIQEMLEDLVRENKAASHLRQPKRVVNGMGVGKYAILRKRQIKLETEAWEEAAKEYQELLADMCEQKLAPNLPYIKSLFLGWFEPLRDAIAAEPGTWASKKQHCRPSHAPFFEHLPADKMAVITMHKLMGLLMTNSGGAGAVKVVQAACAIGEALENEVCELRIFLSRILFLLFYFYGVESESLFL